MSRYHTIKNKLDSFHSGKKHAPKDAASNFEVAGDYVQALPDYLWEAVDLFIGKYGKHQCFVEINSTNDKSVVSLQCPMPAYNQIIFRYVPEDDEIQYMWSIPNLWNCQVYLNDAKTASDTSPELLESIINFQNGTLEQMALGFNADANALWKKEANIIA